MSVNENVIIAFSVDHAARVTGLSKARLTRWDKIGFFQPEHTNPEDRGNPYGRVYSFSDLVGLRTLAVLADDYRVPLRELRKAHDRLKEKADRPWSEISLSVLNREVVDVQERKGVPSGQGILHSIPLPEIAKEVAEKARKLRDRDKALLGTIERHRYVAHNAEVIAGTRIPLSAIKSFMDAGYSDKEIIGEYPTLTKIDLQFVRERLREAA